MGCCVPQMGGPPPSTLPWWSASVPITLLLLPSFRLCTAWFVLNTHTHRHATQLFEPPPCGRAQRFELARAWNVPPRRTAAAATPAAATVQYPAWSRRSPHASAAANGMPCQHTWPVVGVLTASTWPAGSPLTGVQARMAPPPPPFPRLALAQGIQACCRAAAVAAAHPLCHPSPAAVPPPAAPAPPAIA